MDMIPPNFRDSIDFRTPPNCAECEFINLQTGMCQKYDYYCSRVLYYRFSGVTYSSCFHVCDMYQPKWNNENYENIIAVISKGNPGVIRVLVEIFMLTRTVTILKRIAEKKILGEMVWLGYKDFCGRDISIFIKRIMEDDQVLIDQINSYLEQCGEKERCINAK